ncbi:hypothetical protein ZWY2020_004095 [Hordeum vulgare]|nr:hypothetical protein ZWY2020_004095 [Hordeum vulgare]
MPRRLRPPAGTQAIGTDMPSPCAALHWAQPPPPPGSTGRLPRPPPMIWIGDPHAPPVVHDHLVSCVALTISLSARVREEAWDSKRIAKVAKSDRKPEGDYGKLKKKRKISAMLSKLCSEISENIGTFIEYIGKLDRDEDEVAAQRTI